MKSFLIPGEPASWLTAREESWKAQIGRTIGTEGHAPLAIHMQFAVQEWTRRGNHFDLDNLVTPVLRTIFGNSNRQRMEARSGLLQWRASLTQSPVPFLLLDLIHDHCGALIQSQETCLVDEAWVGSMPVDSRSRDCGMAEWIRQRLGGFVSSQSDRFAVSLVFGDSVRDITRPEEKPIKAIIDCLYPMFGGAAGYGEDWKTQLLQIEHRRGLEATCHVQCWRVESTPAVESSSTLVFPRPSGTLRE